MVEQWWSLDPSRIDWAVGQFAGGIQQPNVRRDTKNGVRTVHIHGILSRGGDYWGGTSTDSVAAVLREAAGLSSVLRVVLSINSPGGTFSGTKDLADAVASLAKAKPVVAVITDLGASAAYWVASQARKVYAKPDALIGSIGTYAAMADYSRNFDNAGVKVHVIRADTTGEFKGAGTLGTQITDAQLAEIKRLVTSHNQFFLDAVAQGRGLNQSQLKQVADGRVFTAVEAQRMGLIDGVVQHDADALAMPTVGSSVKAVWRDTRSSLEKWDDIVAQLQHENPQIPRKKVLEIAMQKHRAAYEAACYSDDQPMAAAGSSQPTVVAKAKPVVELSQADAVAQAKAMIDKLAATGMSRRHAFVKLELEHPELIKAVRGR